MLLMLLQRRGAYPGVLGLNASALKHRSLWLDKSCSAIIVTKNTITQM
jgi:hypothetical protein